MSIGNSDDRGPLPPSGEAAEHQPRPRPRPWTLPRCTCGAWWTQCIAARVQAVLDRATLDNRPPKHRWRAS